MGQQKKTSKHSDQLESRIKSLISEQLNIEQSTITLESRFVEDLGADSLDVVELVMAMEEYFNIDIPDDDAEKILTVGHALDFVKSYKKTNSPSN
ncbi:MAG: acyl carrier protein [Proteobacteria bacterium]|nr:acyl carrier protein [Pseudomonadota bacterium]